jgi:hypothetical protein
MQLKFFWAVTDFGLDGIEPKFEGIELAIWIPMRDLILNSKRQDEAWRTKQRENGKKGGRPRKTPIDNETQKNPNTPGVIEETQKTQGFLEKHPKTHNGYGNVIFNENGIGNTVFEKPQKPPPPQIFEKIVSESQRLGFVIDRKKAVEVFNSGIDPSWYEGPFSFFALAAQKATTGRYSGKSHDEQKNIFISAVISWEDLRIEYPAWLESMKKKAEDSARRAARKIAEDEEQKKIDEAREARPTLCECGEELDGMLSCLKCKITYGFDKDALKYLPKPMTKFAMDYARRKQKENRGPGS